MINNQVQSPVSGKNSVISGQASGEAKGEAGKQQGGLFKLLMNSVEGETLNGNGSKNGAANILGGNLTLNTKQEGDSKQSALQLLSESGEESIEDKITLSKLLEGSGSSAEETTETDKEGGEPEVSVSDGSAPDLEDNNEESVNEIPEKDSKKTADGESIQVTADGDTQTALKENSNSEKGTGESGTDKTAETATTGMGIGAEASSTALATGGEQAAALTGDAATITNQAASQKETGNSGKSTNPLNGLIAGKNTAADGKQSGGNAIFNGGKIVNGEELTENRGRASIAGNVNEGLGSDKSEGLVNELRALAAAQGEPLVAGKQERLTPEHLDGSAPAEDATILQEIFSALQSGSIEQVAAEIRSMRASQIRESKYSNHLASFANRQELSNTGNSLSGGTESTASTSQAGSVSTMMPLTAMVPSSSSISGDMFDENASVLWKEQITEYFESKDKSSAENQAAAAFARLGDVPVTNISVRKSFAQGISKAIISSASQGNKGSEVWQKHNFVLEDGKNIQLSAREVDGVLQLKLSSSYNELNKLLAEHEKEIRELLENELELKIDLQMDGGDSNAADFFGGSTGQQSSGKGGVNPLDLGSLRRTEEKEVEKVVPRAVRKFGYNQNEWTV